MKKNGKFQKNFKEISNLENCKKFYSENCKKFYLENCKKFYLENCKKF